MTDPQSAPAATYPIYAQDASKANRLIVSANLRFDHVLDAEKLKLSLSKLLQIGHWRKLTGRLRKQHNGDWELRVPDKVTPDHPDFAFRHTIYEECIAHHPVGKAYPTPTQTASTQSLNKAIHPLLVPPDFPSTFDEMVQREWPQLSLFVSSFNDATIVSILWPHTLWDASALQSFLRNWSLVMAGKEQQVDSVFWSCDDPLKPIDSLPDAQLPHVLESQGMPWWKVFVFGFCFVWRLLTSPKPEKRFIYLPKTSLERLRSRTMAEAIDASKDLKIFLTEGDIVTAWLARAVVTATQKRVAATIVDVVDLRSRLTFLEPQPTVYLQNLLAMATTTVSAAQMRSSVGSIALLRRQALSSQLAEREITKLARKLRSAARRSSLPPVFYGSSRAVIIPFNNVSRSNYMDATDFGPAVLRSTDSAPEHPPAAKPTFAFTEPISMMSIAGFCFVWGKDASGGLWLTTSMSKKGWDLLEEDLATL
ncbi:hypothetical protein V2A60_009612 [Cordyceps javanica]